MTVHAGKTTHFCLNMISRFPTASATKKPGRCPPELFMNLTELFDAMLRRRVR